jgi:hypothetical protein
MARFARLLQTAGEIARVTSVVRAPLFISLFGSVCLFLPDQTREVYRILAQPGREHGPIQLLCAVLTLLVATLVPWIVGRHLTYVHAKDLLGKQSLAGYLSRWLPRVCGALIPLGVAYGLFLASGEMEFHLPKLVIESDPGLAQVSVDAVRVAIYLKWASALCLLLVVVLLMGALLPARLLPNTRLDAPPLWYTGAVGLMFLAFVVAASIVLSFAPVAIPETMGALALLLVFIATLILFAGSLTGYFDHYRVPAVSCIFLLAVVFSAFNWNDNHTVRLQDRAPGSLPPPEEALTAWLDSRADKGDYGENPYPVFFVTAAGGGMYAAYHAAAVLARLQDRCPNFAQHVFSISAVSGGSLGASVFTGLAKHYAPNTAYQDCLLGSVPAGSLERRVQRYFLNADLLAPVVGASLFPDFLQRFLPLKFDRFDRARALEASVADAWSRAAPEKENDNPFLAPFLAHRDDANPGPALILNAADVARGYRVAITPFEIVYISGRSNLAAITKINEFHNIIRGAPPDQLKFNQDITLGTAVGLSARFPWILPAGTVTRAQGDFRLVDGGYFENSGAETALDLLRSLGQTYRGQRKISVHIIAISSLQFVERPSWQGIGEILSPVRTMLSTRDSRGSLALYRASNFIRDCQIDESCKAADDKFMLFPLNLVDFPIPLGWQLSPISARLIGLHSGFADKINTSLTSANTSPTSDFLSEKPGPRILGYVDTANESSCTVQKILQRPGEPHECTAP